MNDENINDNAENSKKTVGKPFKKGESGNPSGRPKLPPEFKELAKNKSVEALKKVIAIMESKDSDPKDVLRASEIVMDRAWGKSTAVVDASINGRVIFTDIDGLED